jgi:acyl carrier protein
MEQELKKIMAKLFGIQEIEINDESSRKTIKAWDSIRHLRLTLSIEEEFGIPPLTMDEIVEMTSFMEIKRILRSKGVSI